VIVLETLGRRWFAFAFIAGLLWAAWPEGGWRRALRFLVIAFGVSLAAEYSSTHNGFPYGRYDYIAHTRGDELYISNIPLFVPISFGTMVWGARALAVAVLFWVRRPRGRIEWGDAAPRIPLVQLVLGTAVAAAILDLIVDPMSLRGDSWFMGELFAYRHGSWYFGVPWSNFGGWMLASAAIVLLDSLLASGTARQLRIRVHGRTLAPPAAQRPDATVRGLVLAFGTCVFSVGLALATSHWAIAAATGGISIALAATVAPGILAARRLPGTAPPPEPPGAGVREPRRPTPSAGPGAQK
jgi:putative membrane protein